MQPTETTGSALGEPTWEIARLFPRQGQWTEADYLSIKSNQLMELSEGRLEMLPMPTQGHQLIVAFLYRALLEFTSIGNLGLVLFAPLRIKVREGQIREPDIVFMREENKHRRADDYWTGADLVVEVVSNDDPNRDVKIKRQEYAEAGIPEYWIVDPRNSSVSVLTLKAGDLEYAEAGIYQPGQQAASVLLNGFVVDVSAVFDAATA